MCLCPRLSCVRRPPVESGWVEGKRAVVARQRLFESPAAKRRLLAIPRRCRLARPFGSLPPPADAWRAHPATEAKHRSAFGSQPGYSSPPVYAETFLNGNVIFRQALINLVIFPN